MDNALSLLGLIYRARKIVLGEEVLNQMKKIRLVLIASDISQGSRERIEKKCHFYNVGMIDRYESGQLSAALGKNNVKVIGITDKGFADSFLSKI